MSAINPRNVSEQDLQNTTSGRDKIKLIAAYSMQAPSTHNSQPWLLEITDRECRVYPDKNLELPEADPLGRDLYISLGCLVENLIITAKYLGVFSKITYPTNEQPIATVKFGSLDQPAATNSEHKRIFKAIASRHNARGVFKDKSVPSQTIEKLRKLSDRYPSQKISIIESKQKIRKLACLTAEGIEIAYDNPSFRQEFAKWLNHNLSARQEGIPGYALHLAWPTSLLLPWIIRLTNPGSKLSELNYETVNSAPAVVLISAEKNNQESWLKVGQLAQRIMLILEANGFQSSIFSAAIEMGNLSERLQKTTEISDALQFMLCFGNMKRHKKLTPRHNLNDKLMGFG